MPSNLYIICLYNISITNILLWDKYIFVFDQNPLKKFEKKNFELGRVWLQNNLIVVW